MDCFESRKFLYIFDLLSNINRMLQLMKLKIKGEIVKWKKQLYSKVIRKLIRDLNDIKEALKDMDYENAEKLLDHLIEDTQKGIED